MYGSDLMKKISMFILLFLGIFSLASCNDNTGGNNDNDNENIDDGKDVVTDNSGYSYAEPDFSTPKHTAKSQFVYDDLFNLGNKVSINVEVPDDELRALQSDYETGLKSEIYRRASKVTITIRNNNEDFIWTFDNVGIRQKGNTSRRSIFDDGNPSKLNKNHYKLSFDETFTNKEMYSASYINKYGNAKNSTREFLGLSGIDIKWNKNYDMTHIKEVYSQMMYNSFGVISQKAGIASFKLNNLDYGIVTIYQKASKSLIKESLKKGNIVNMPSWDEEKKGTNGITGENYGDLYKCTYGTGHDSGWGGPDMSKNSISGSGIGVSNISGSYIPIYDRKTAVDASYNDFRLKNLVNTVNNKNYSEIEKLVDMEYFAVFQAVGYFVGNPDDMRYDFNNYMIYIRRTDGKAVFVPIDQDRCFGIIKDWNVMEGLMHVDIFGKECANNQDQRNQLILKTILDKNTECSKEYVEWIKTIASSKWVSSNSFNELFRLAKQTYSGYEFNLEDNNYSFDLYITNKLKAVNKYIK
jgi:spore coat protein CotH